MHPTLLSPEFTQATGTKTFAPAQPIALQLVCIGSWSMINYRTHVTVKIGHKVVEEYFNITNIEHYNAILGTPFLRKMGIILDFRSPGIIWMGNKIILTGKVSFNESKDTDEDIAAIGNILQDGRAALEQEWSQGGGLQAGPPKGSPHQDKGTHPHPRLSTWGKSSIPLRGTSGHTWHNKVYTLRSTDIERRQEHLRTAPSHDVVLRDNDIPQLHKSWDKNIIDLVSGIPLELLPIQEVNHDINLIDPEKHIYYQLLKCPEHFHEELSQKIERYTTAQW